MMAIVRRILGQEKKEHDAEKERQQQYERITAGLHEAAQRVHFLEMEAELRARGGYRPMKLEPPGRHR